ncbi:heat-inducible transcription repressor HrcA [Planifilum fimeticola]|jgi:heat-inducible transcriptional repressor|uniref:Heat-inducible transcription repressor HrcA n=1 Tax=Planifilum fimeticola TaxID=201975 RepID=A0A2T0LFX9_9BACL|nr:heat-inducible transcriptional repressor HrcA [Planifilum fimeticola]PRX41146.1 heat-inducible transcription repressor HrcA [Planifilum fimeticola]
MLTERQKKILQAVVDDYILTAEPVGSRTVSKRKGVGFSAATIRNEMADLEEMGYLEQPHTSAGRIPSHKGYRYYVDHLLPPLRPRTSDIRMLKRLFTIQMDELEQVFQETASILSKLTKYTTVILGPMVYEDKLRHLQVVPLSENNAVVVIVTDAGHVEKRRFTVPEKISLSSIEKLVNLLNHRLKGLPLHRLKQTVQQELQDELARYVDQYEYLMTMIDEMLRREQEERIYFSGTTNILNQPEFRDVEKVKRLFDLFDQTDVVLQLFGTTDSGVQVRIGKENRCEAVDNCSIISASYTVNGRSVGTISVLGPTRMNYKKVISLLEVLAIDFSDHLRRLFG